MELEEIVEQIVAFRDERDWGQFHSPHQLAKALSIEAAELQELFLWKEADEVEVMLQDQQVREEAEREVADVLIYALLFCEAIGVDPSQTINRKLKENEEKYPVDLARGRSDKYTDLDNDDA